MWVVTLLLLSVTFIFNGCCFALMTLFVASAKKPEMTILIRWNWRTNSDTCRFYFCMDSNFCIKVLYMRSFQKYCLCSIFPLCWNHVLWNCKCRKRSRCENCTSPTEFCWSESDAVWETRIGQRLNLSYLAYRKTCEMLWKFCKAVYV